MRAPVLQGQRSLRVEDVAEPVADAGQVVVEVALCGICGSDLHLYALDGAPSGLVLGHEYSGRIAAVGEGVDGWQLGDRVTPAPLSPCRSCYFCRRDEPHLCGHHYRLEMQARGEPGVGLGTMGYAPLAPVRADRLLRVPDSLSDRQAASIEPAAVGYHAVRRAGQRLGDRVVVIGAGPIGLFTLQAVRLEGAARVVALELSPRRSEAARVLGADAVLDPRDLEAPGALSAALNDALGGEPDLVYDAAGVPSTLQQSVDLVRVGGSVMMVGVAFESATIRPSVWVTKRVTVRASFAYTREDYAHTIALLERGAIDVEPLITSVVSVAQTPDAFERLLKATDEIKVLVDPHLG